MKNRRNYYRILHVQPDAPTEVIRSSYRTMMQRLKMHPDLGGEHTDAALVNEAYTVLTNAAARAEYDAGIGVGSPRASATGTADGKAGDDAGSPEAADSHAAGAAQCAFCLTSCRDPALIDPEETCRRCGSALYPAQRQRFEEHSQRAIARVAKRVPALYWTGWPDSPSRRGVTEDLSLSGMQLRTDQALERGRIIRVTAGSLDAVATVVDSQCLAVEAGYRWRIGLSFITLRIHGSRGTFISVDA